MKRLIFYLRYYILIVFIVYVIWKEIITKLQSQLLKAFLVYVFGISTHLIATYLVNRNTVQVDIDTSSLRT